MDHTSRPTLARELLWNLALLVAGALSLAVATALVAQTLRPGLALLALLALIGADLVVLFLFGRYLIGRLVLRPVAALTDVADALVDGDLSRRAPAAETREFTRLAERLNGMTEALLDAQSQLVRAEKLAGIGRLAAGVAHEIGNPLTAVGTYLDVLERRGADPEVVGAVRRETERIDRIVRGLLSYARPSDEGMSSVDVEDVLRRVVDLLGQQGALRDREVTIACPAQLAPVRGHAHDLEQVIVNLLLNALDAAPDGAIVLGAEPAQYDPRATAGARRGETVVPGSRGPVARRPWRAELPVGSPGVLIYVTDAGPGIPASDRERVFDPFYTTKAPGRGTGLGLAIVQRAVHEMGGVIWVEDAREGGAAFKIFLPSEPTEGQP